MNIALGKTVTNCRIIHVAFYLSSDFTMLSKFDTLRKSEKKKFLTFCCDLLTTMVLNKFIRFPVS